MECVKLGSMTEFNTLLDKSPVTVIDFSASWCGAFLHPYSSRRPCCSFSATLLSGPCKMLSPQLDELAKNPSIQGAKFFKIDVDESGDVAEAMSIQAMPVTLFFLSAAFLYHCNIFLDCYDF